jgi:hypothetical protein
VDYKIYSNLNSHSHPLPLLPHLGAPPLSPRHHHPRSTASVLSRCARIPGHHHRRRLGQAGSDIGASVGGGWTSRDLRGLRRRRRGLTPRRRDVADVGGETEGVVPRRWDAIVATVHARHLTGEILAMRQRLGQFSIFLLP